MFELERVGEVFVLHMKAGENRFNRGFIDGINDALDEVEASEGPAALVTTGEGKFYSNGLDLEWLMSGEGGDIDSFLAEVHRLFARILGFSMLTVAAVNGHAFAGGAMLATAHDFKIMRSDRGYFCFPEIDLKMPLTPGMAALITARLSKRAAHESIITGRRYSAEQAAALDIVDAVAGEAEVVPRSIKLAAEFTAKDRGAMSALKAGVYGPAIATLSAGSEN